MTKMEEVAKMAAKEAVAELRREDERKRRSRIFQNTKALMENYNRIMLSVDEGISDLKELTDDPIEGIDDENVFVESIIKSKARSLIMLAHIDKCLELLEREEYRRNTPERYLAFKYLYIDGMTHESIAEVLGCADRTSRRWITDLTRSLSVYLFGVDALRL